MLEPKPFKQVFPELKSSVPGNLLSFLTVNRLAYSKDKKYLYIYIDAERLIDRASFLRIEKDITKQFLQDEIAAHFIVHFSLPDTYTLENVIDEYRDSLIGELADENPLYRSFLRKCRFTAEGDHRLMLEFEDNPLVRLQEKKWKKYYQDLFMNRFDYDIDVAFSYGEAYQPATVPLRIFCWSTAFSYIGVARTAWMQCEKMTRYETLISLFGCIINITLNYIP